jgi:hypothetical protein
MEAARPTTLYLLCGKIAAGKSTLARRIAERPSTLLITMDHWMSILFPIENRTIEDFTRLSARLRAAMGPHLVDVIKGFVHFRHDVKSIENIHRVGTTLTDHPQVRLPHVRADEFDTFGQYGG